MTEALQGFRPVAYNPVPASETRIHGDEVARQHGFRGRLVPGVVVSAYLLDPALRSFGLDALGRGYAEVAVHKPLDDGDAFEVKLEAEDARLPRGAVRRPSQPARRGSLRAARCFAPAGAGDGRLASALRRRERDGALSRDAGGAARAGGLRLPDLGAVADPNRFGVCARLHAARGTPPTAGSGRLS